MSNKSAVRGPRSFSKSELNKVDVALIDDRNNLLECQRCGQQWSPLQPPMGRRFTRGYWKCPEGCNG